MPRRRRLPQAPRSDHVPRPQPVPRMPTTPARPPAPEDDPEIYRVRDWIRSADPDSARMARIIRETFDQIYDGQRTGRWDYDQLYKTEKTHIGTLIQINIQKEFALEDGERLDFRIAGVDVDCKFSRLPYAWMIPNEMWEAVTPQLALVVWASDYESLWWLGLVRIEERYLRPGRTGRGNRDEKRTLTEEGMDRVLPVAGGALVENTLLHMTRADRDYVFQRGPGQPAVDRLFERLPCRLVSRATILTVAQQDDSVKRVRDARLHLRDEGFVILGHYRPHPTIAMQLGIPAPTVGQFVSVRLWPFRDGDNVPFAVIQGRRWRRAADEDPIAPAPLLSRQGRAPAEG